MGLAAAMLIGGTVSRAASAETKVESCIGASGTSSEALGSCIGKASRACIGPDEAAMPPSEVSDCLNKEQAQWDRVLNDAYRALLKGLDETQQPKLREMQRAWIEARKLSCNFYEDYFQGSMAYPMIANCMNLETARRAIFLLGFARDMASWKK